MQSKTATVVLSTPKEKVFAYLANIENMPKWSTEFCKQLKTIDGKTKVVTDKGELFFQIRADEKTGVIDLIIGPTEDQMNAIPSRVVDLPGGACAYLFTLFQAPNMSDEDFEHGYRSLLREFENIRREFNGA